jgi:hypothetical protein
VPADTEWHVRVAPTYPWGRIEIYPDAERGIQETFHHQDYNAPIPDRPFRAGKLCVATALRGFARRGYDSEPYEAEERLCWYILRALDWVHAAATSDLVRAGEPYELPSFELREGTNLAFSEDRASLAAWGDIPDRSGLVELRAQGNAPRVHVVSEFQTVAGRTLLAPAWGGFLECPGADKTLGIWIRLEETPVLRPWKAPMIWGELRQVCEAQGVDLDLLLRPAVSALHEEKQAGYGLLGFPVPAEIGSEPVALHWQAFRLPRFGKKAANGFRPNELGRWIHNQTQHFAPNSPMRWLPSENWTPDQLSTRGHLPQELRELSVAVLGAGALGSAVSELLLRAGVHRMVIVDGELLHAGNLARHTLLLDDVLRPKATQLASRLDAASPNARVEGIVADFPDFTDEQRERVAGCDLILDLTADDELLRHADSYPWRAGQVFISGSLGMGSKRLFCYACEATGFSHQDFQTRMAPWLRTEVTENAGCHLPREGLGCWHPVFPARIDDVWMMASVLVKSITDYLVNGDRPRGLAVFEQEEDEGFSGIRRIKEESLVA